MGILVWKKGKWMEAPEWTADNWDAFAEAAKAQASLDDAVAYASSGFIAVEDLALLDAQCLERFHVGLAAYYNQWRAIGRVAFMVAAREAAEKSQGAAAWFGEKVLGVGGEKTLPQKCKDCEPVTVLVDV